MKIASLSEMPKSYALARENRRTDFELREMHCGLSGRTTHRVLFRVRHDVIEVLAVRHVAQDDLSSDEI